MRGFAALLTAAALFGAITWFALESNEVAVLRTRTPTGAFEETRVWVADVDGAALIEAATPERPWYQSLRTHPDVELLRDGAPLRYRALPEPGPEGRERIRTLLRAKYGWADWWVSLLQDSSDSVLIRLEPLDRASAAHRYATVE
ncbi:MAG: hypothetical protein OZ948_11495 [Deltaproteobacteria bacterium]|nr:hypothetical protein [Deltaproteobacteria bacterium]